MSKTPLPTLTVRLLAAQAGVDERSFKKVLAGGHVRGIAGERIRAALEQHAASAAQQQSR